jgi:glutathione S-transferase
MLTLYQAEWCPFSSVVRELLTERGIDFVARQVEPWPEQREQLRQRAGSDVIPVLEDEKGHFYRGTREILDFLEQVDGWEHGGEHRRRFGEHYPARERDVAGQLLDRAGRRASRSPHDSDAAESSTTVTSTTTSRASTSA